MLNQSQIPKRRKAMSVKCVVMSTKAIYQMISSAHFVNTERQILKRWLPARRSDPRSHAAIMYRSARNVMGSIFTRKSTKQIFTELYKEVPR